MWGVKSIIKKEFHGEPVYNEQYLKTKIKSYKRQINTKFHNNKIPKEGLQFIFWSDILIDSVLEQAKIIILKYS